MSQRVIVMVGFAGPVGGAGTESFETAKMFRRHALAVHMVPTWEAPPPDRRREVEQQGVVIHDIRPPQLPGLLRDLGGPPVVSFINEKFLPHAYRIRETSPWIHIPCMTYVHSWERVAFKKSGLPDALVFQSEFQREVYHHGLLRHGYRQEIGHSIRGAFEFQDWPYCPLAREPGAPFVVGRVARADPSKWNGQLFRCLDPVPNVRALFMGADEAVRRNIGRRKYATIWPPGHMPARQFYAGLHAMIAMNGGAKENWPRVGLEAMSLGVPLVVDGHWGWPEMVQHGQTGFLARHATEFAEYLTMLEHDEATRLRITEAARWSLEHVLANPAAIWRGWCDLFRRIGAGHLAEETADDRSPLQRDLDRALPSVARDQRQGPADDQLAAPPQDSPPEAPGRPIAPTSQDAEETPQDAGDAPVCRVEDPASDQRFIAGESIRAGQPVHWGPDRKLYGIPVEIDDAFPSTPDIRLARPGPFTEIVYIPGEEIQAGHPLEIVPSPDGELEIHRADHETGLVAQETLDRPMVTIDEFGNARNLKQEIK